MPGYWTAPLGLVDLFQRESIYAEIADYGTGYHVLQATHFAGNLRAARSYHKRSTLGSGVPMYGDGGPVNLGLKSRVLKWTASRISSAEDEFISANKGQGLPKQSDLDFLELTPCSIGALSLIKALGIPAKRVAYERKDNQAQCSQQ